MFGFFKSRKAKEAAAIKEHLGSNHFTLGSESPPLGKKLGATAFRFGMWIVFEGRTGIAQEVTKNPITEAPELKFHLVDQTTGHTLLEMQVPLEACRQARHDEIPDGRRKHIPDHVLIGKGYA